MFAVVKDEFLIAVDPKSNMMPESTGSTGKILKEQVLSPSNKPFKSFAWSQPVNQLGKYLYIWKKIMLIQIIQNNNYL